MQALAALPADLHWRFAHVGGGDLLKSLKAQAEKSGLGDRVAFLGAKAQPDIIALLREADLFVLPSKKAASGDRDGLPNVLMEAASQKLAIVASDFAGIPEFIRDGSDGVLVPPGDWEALSNAINLLAREPERRVALADSAFERLRRDFSMEGGIDLLEERFRAILDPAATVAVARVTRLRATIGVLCAAEEPGPSLPVRRQDHGAAAAEGVAGGRVSRPRSRAVCARMTRRAIGDFQERARREFHRRGRAVDRALPRPSGTTNARLCGSPITSITRRRTGSARASPRPRHSLRGCRRIARGEARRGSMVARPPGRRAGARPGRPDLHHDRPGQARACRRRRPRRQTLVDLPPFLDEAEWERSCPHRRRTGSDAAASRPWR